MAGDDLGEVAVALAIDHDQNVMHMAEEIVVVAHHILIRAGEKDAQVVRLAVQRMEFERLLDVVQVDEVINLAVRVAG